ncbi:MAG TPA: hypothetical protein VL651_10600 [Bacteroidia bacterium]|jgi:hypothetical protein|nr:hypothetical protein [Bacteroidia bacterium]
MKKIKSILVLMTLVGGLYAQTAVTPPAIVKTKFDSMFPTATAVKWVKSGVDYEADFTNGTKTMKVKYAKTGVYMERQMMIDQSALPENAKNYILTHYAGKNVLNVYKVTKSNGNVTYTASVGGKALKFDSSGNYVAASGTATKAKPK